MTRRRYRSTLPILVLAAQLACVGDGTTSEVDLLDRCVRHTDCPRDDLACENGVCRPVADPECRSAADCVDPVFCEVLEGARCVTGVCEYVPMVCNTPPPNECVDGDTKFKSYSADGYCDAATGLCDYPSLEQDCAGCTASCLSSCAGVVCDDDNGGCRSGGICVSGTPPACEYVGVAPDETPCTLPGDSYSLFAGRCVDGECRGCVDDDDCGLGGVCRSGRCEIACAPGVACDDDNPCTYDDACGTNGICRGTAVTEHGGCQDDPGVCGARRSCNGTASCLATFPGSGVSCDDGQICTHSDVCDGAGGCGGTTVICNDDAGPCGAQRTCNGTAICTVSMPGGTVSCNDGVACTHTDRCDGSGGCSGQPVTEHNGCEDGAGPCGAQRSCNGTASCSEIFPDTAVSCNDGVACTHTDRCDGVGGCSGQPVTDHGGCQDDAGPCGAQRSCNGTATCSETFAGTTTGCDDGNICTENDRCNGVGGCGGDACGGGDVCFPSFGCYPPPTISQPTACGNLGQAHLSPPWLAEYTVTGPPGAHVIKYNRLESCNQSGWDAASETPTNPSDSQAKFIGGGGAYLFELGNSPVTNCEGEGYGEWESYASVDGVSTTNTIFTTFYNSNCYSGPTSPPSRYRKIDTCAGARNFCSPCNDGLGCATEGEYCDVYSGGSASCQAPYVEFGPTCADLGVSHAGSPGLTWYRVYGPEGARVHKYNNHASCTGSSWGEASETSGSVVRIGSTGYYELTLPDYTPLWSCSDSPLAGRWDSYAAIGDDAEEFRRVETTIWTAYYYDSTCSAFNTCPSEASSYCCSSPCIPW